VASGKEADEPNASLTFQEATRRFHVRLLGNALEESGWNVMEVSRTHGYPSVRVYWACPPGRVPMEAQGQVLSSGVGATTVPSGPVAIKTGETISDQAPPSILANIASAGDDPTVSAARNVVSKWSFVIPVVSLLMSAKNKLTGGGSPTSAAIVKTGRSR